MKGFNKKEKGLMDNRVVIAGWGIRRLNGNVNNAIKKILKKEKESQKGG